MTGLPPRNKVGLVGTGMVGASFAYALMQSGVANELILIDADEARAEGEAMDLNHGMPFVSPMRIRAGGYDQLTGCDLTVITAGANQRPGQTRLELIQKNAGVIRDIVPKVVGANPKGAILVATNPVDVLTEIAAEVAGLPPGLVFGSGTTLDTARFRFLIGDYFEVNPQSVHAYIIGEHGDSAVPVWSMAKIGGIPVSEFQGRDGKRADAKVMQQIYEQARDAAYEIIQRKKSTYYAIGLALRTVVEAVLRNEQTVLTVCSPIQGLYGVDGISLSLPTIVGHGGAETVLQSPISPMEIELFRKSAAILREMYDSVRD